MKCCPDMGLLPSPLPIDIIINGQLLMETKTENSHYWFESSLEFFKIWK